MTALLIALRDVRGQLVWGGWGDDGLDVRHALQCRCAGVRSAAVHGAGDHSAAGHSAAVPIAPPPSTRSCSIPMLCVDP